MNTSDTMRAVIADPARPGELVIGEAVTPVPQPGEVRVKVEAFSLNAGEVRSALAAERRYIPGWDFAGVVDIASTDGGSPAAGTPVYGLYAEGAWAEYHCVPANKLVALPIGVTVLQAAGLPVAGLTAMLGLRKGGDLAGKRVLITGAAGGVGRYACQMATNAGALLSVVSRRTDLAGLLAADGIAEVTVFADIAAAGAAGHYDYILDSVGGSTLAGALAALNPDGVVVNCGNSANEKTSFDVRDFYFKDGTQLHGLFLGRVMMQDPRPHLAELAAMVASGAIRVPASEPMSWTGIAAAARQLSDQRVNGKIILTID